MRHRLHMLLSKWLVGCRRRGTTVARVQRLVLVAGAECGTLDALVRVWRLLGDNLLVRRFAGAAADGDQPEEA